jgi:hypothetical protein
MNPWLEEICLSPTAYLHPICLSGRDIAFKIESQGTFQYLLTIVDLITGGNAIFPSVTNRCSTFVINPLIRCNVLFDNFTSAMAPPARSPIYFGNRDFSRIREVANSRILTEVICGFPPRGMFIAA